MRTSHRARDAAAEKQSYVCDTFTGALGHPLAGAPAFTPRRHARQAGNDSNPSWPNPWLSWQPLSRRRGGGVQNAAADGAVTGRRQRKRVAAGACGGAP